MRIHVSTADVTHMESIFTVFSFLVQRLQTPSPDAFRPSITRHAAHCIHLDVRAHSRNDKRSGSPSLPYNSSNRSPQVTPFQFHPGLNDARSKLTERISLTAHLKCEGPTLSPPAGSH
ncbi:hypothetical protein Bbelb_086600 [Branchiostoma belcheri]|nr:hypothetical protein Bbelb_086600 [Branchiostoma belcheri]